MTTMILMLKGNDIKHTYSLNVKNNLIEQGYKCVATISGRNMSINYSGL